MLVGEHEGFINAGEGLILRVFEQAGRADRHRIMNLRKIGPQILGQHFRKRSEKEAAFDFSVIGAMDGEIVQVVLGEELVEDVGGEHERRRDGDTNAAETAGHSVLVEKMANEGEAASFSAERAAADAKEECVCGFEGGGIEVADENFALFAAILGDGIDQSWRRSSCVGKSETLRGRISARAQIRFAPSASGKSGCARCDRRRSPAELRRNKSSSSFMSARASDFLSVR